MGVSYMKMEERDRLIKEEGRREGRSEGRNEGETLKLISMIQKKILKGKDLEKIAGDLDEDIENIRGIYDVIMQNPKKSSEYILTILKNEA